MPVRFCIYLCPKKSRERVDLGCFLKKKFGSMDHRLPEHLQIHKKIELSSFDPQVISETYSNLYRKGLSLSDISKQTGKAKSVIRENLARAGIELRSNIAISISKMKAERGKTNIRTPYSSFRTCSLILL